MRMWLCTIPVKNKTNINHSPLLDKLTLPMYMSSELFEGNPQTYKYILLEPIKSLE